MSNDTHRIVDAIMNLRRALADAGLDAPFAIEFDEPGAGYHLVDIMTAGLRTAAVEADALRHPRQAPEAPRFRHQGEIAGAKVRWPAAHAYVASLLDERFRDPRA